MRTLMKVLMVAAVVYAAPVSAQQASMVYRLGKDTIAVEQFTRTPTRFTGEVVRRNPSVLRLQYDVTLGSDGRPTRATVRQRLADGSVVPNAPTELRLTFMADSVRRENVFADSTQTRTIAARSALFVLTWPSVATVELLAAAQKRAPADSFVGVGVGAQPQWFRLAPARGDTLRLVGGPYPFQLLFDAQGALQMADGNYTTNKMFGTRGPGGLDLAAIATKMAPGVLSTRGTASAGFGPVQSPVTIDYGRPLVRERTVWGGALVPFDTVWRVGANAATHFSTARALAFGDLAVPAGLYTLWIQHTRTGTFLIINKGVGQWGTQRDATQDLGRAPMQLAPAPEFVEQFTITIRAMPQNRGAIDFAWGPSVATATFVLR